VLYTALLKTVEETITLSGEWYILAKYLFSSNVKLKGKNFWWLLL
jgi:hypothetical protein